MQKNRHTRMTIGLQGLLLVALMAASAAAQESAAEDPVDRQIRYNEELAVATELLMDGRAAEALPELQRLQASYGDLDDGFLAMGLADCLRDLGQKQEAHVAYRAAARFPQFEQAARYQAREMELSGHPDPLLIQELRAEASRGDDESPAARWQLARALQKQAKAMLAESAGLFREAAQVQSDQAFKPTGLARAQAESLEELVEDVGQMIDQLEQVWARVARPVDMPSAGIKRPQVGSMKAEWSVDDCQAGLIKIVLEQPEGGCLTLTVNGKTVQVDERTALLIRRHQERIAQIAFEASTGGPEQQANQEAASSALRAVIP